MQYRTLGKTGLSLSVIGIGALQMGSCSLDETKAILREAHRGGMNYIDTARAYGDSEKKLGQALKELGLREQFYLSSKVIKRDLPSFQNDFETTMANLQTDYLDIFFIHDVSTKSNWEAVQKNGLLDYALELKRQGRIRHLGISTHDCQIGESIIRTGLFEAAMLAYNPTNREVEDTLFPLCRKMDMGVLVMKPYGGGILTEKRSAEMGFSITARDALRFAASHPFVTSVIPGTDRLEYVHLGIEVGSGRLDMSEKERRAIIDTIDIKVKDYCRGCGYCLPCVRNIPIPTVLKLYNRWQVFGGTDWSHMHHITEEYTATVPQDLTADHCISCMQCTQRCPFNLPIPELMKKAAKELRRYVQ